MRKTALAITASCLEAHAKAKVQLTSRRGGSDTLEEAVLDIKEEYLGSPLKPAVMKQVMATLCKSLKVKIHKRAESSKTKGKKSTSSSKKGAY